ncbi:hypothetical protein EXIGLDRAFT_728713 [Exidia glandulosa HHB12029]|uniref:Uncharacterized protein n=1 Tax=Exidia glandulosa HHB12029 TaxID=1314781 RepID=A0A165LS61_EXIGL|nr:hypothetical protein EXIGLDRAFT_728713 [Exidia glandulosa HHB12029]
MSQFSRTFANAASSLASKRHYSVRLPLPPLGASSPRSPPQSPNSAFFPLMYHARSPSLSGSPPQVTPPFATVGTPAIPRSPSQMQFFPTPPRSPSQMQFTFGSPMLQAQSSFVDLRSQSASPASVDSVPQDVAPQPRPIAGRKSKAANDDAPKKRGLNAFTYYRKTFRERYPDIDDAIPTQKDRSTVTGAIWQAEDAEVKAFCQRVVQPHERTVEEAERLEFIRTTVSNKRKKERAAAGTDKLTGRNALIFRLWEERRSKAEIVHAMQEYDEAHPAPEPSRKRQRKNGNAERKKKAVTEEVVPVIMHQPAPSYAAYESPLTFPSPLTSASPYAELYSLPASSPAPSSPAGVALSSPAHSVASLPSVDVFAPQLSFDAETTATHWSLLDLLSRQPAVAAPVAQLPIVVEVEQQPTTSDDIASAFNYDDVMMQLTDAFSETPFLDPSDPTHLPFSLGGEDNLAAFNLTYNFPEHYGRPPPPSSDHNMLPTQEDGPLFDMAYFTPALDA